MSLGLDGFIDSPQGHQDFYFPDRKLRLERRWEAFRLCNGVCVCVSVCAHMSVCVRVCVCACLCVRAGVREGNKRQVARSNVGRENEAAGEKGPGKTGEEVERGGRKPADLAAEGTPVGEAIKRPWK